MTPQDESLIRRVVGYFEYGSALRLFDEFVRTATDEELRGADAIVRTRPEFTVYSHLARRLRGPPVNEAVGAFGERYDRLAFPWVIALARVELCGIVATFSLEKSAFTVVAPTPYEQVALQELVLDGALMHYLSLTRDPRVSAVAKKRTPDQETLAYLRRLLVAQRFNQAVRVGVASKLAPIELAEFVAQSQRMKQVADSYRGGIESYLNSVSVNRDVRDIAEYERLCGLCGGF